jgi:hypothetical protein
VGEYEIERMVPLADRFVRPDWVRRMNAMGDSVGGARRLVRIDADELLENAIESLAADATHPLDNTANIEALGEFGDPHWLRRLHALVDGVNAVEMNVVGRLMTKQEILRSLRTRLLLGREWSARPEIAEETIVAPVIVTGPARSGTSILFELLWLDPDLRGPVGAEVLHPVPVTDFSANDSRLAMTECEQEFWADVQPEFAAIHELRSDLPVECVTLTAPSFCGSHWAMLGVSAMEMDMPESYAFEKRLLQVLQHGRPTPTWLLKTPGHMMTIDLVFETFPDAWVVMTHRDPARTMPSTVSTTAIVQWLRTEHVDLATLARMIGAVFSAGLGSVSTRRATGDLPYRFVDVHFQDLLRDPVDAIRRAYAAMERDFRSEHEARIRDYLKQKPRGKFGVHRYTPEEWGFTKDEVRAVLADYIERERIELEA